MTDLVGFRNDLVDRFNIAVRHADMGPGNSSLRQFLYDRRFSMVPKPCGGGRGDGSSAYPLKAPQKAPGPR